MHNTLKDEPMTLEEVEAEIIGLKKALVGKAEEGEYGYAIAQWNHRLRVLKQLASLMRKYADTSE